MKDLLKSLAAFFTGKNSEGTTIKMDETNETVTIAKADAELLVAEAGKVATLSDEIVQLKADVDAAKQEALKATEAKDALNTKVTELEAEVETLGKQPGALGTTAEKIEDKIESETDKNDPFAEVNAEHKAKLAAWK